MALKKTDLERLKAASITDRLTKSAPPARYGTQSHLVSRREQRSRDRAQGLIPFAVKLPGELVKKLHARAQHQGMSLNEVVAQLLEKGLQA